MRRSRYVSFAFIAARAMAVAFFAGTGASPAFAQQRAGSTEPPAFILGTVSGDPGTTAGIPLYFTPGAGQPIRRVHLEVEFVSNSVKFAKAQKGAAAAVQDFDLAVEAKELPPDDKNIQRTRLNIDVTVTNSDRKKSLQEGLLSFLNFQVPTNAKAFAIELKPLTISAQDAANKPVKVTAEPGKIIIALPDEPMVGCFFFTH